MTILYQPERNRFLMPTPSGDTFVSIRWENDVMVMPHAEVPASLRGTGAGGRLATGVFELIEQMGVKARVTCPFLIRAAQADPRWRRLFNL